MLSDTHYKNYEGLLISLAFKFSNDSPLTQFEELKGETNVAYCKAIRDFDVTKNVKFSTHLYTYTKNHLINYITKNPVIYFELTEEYESINPYLDLEKQLLLIEEIFNNDYLKTAFEVAHKTNRIKEKVTEIMRERGKTWNDIRINVAKFNSFVNNWG